MNTFDIYLAIYGRSLRKIQYWVDPDKSLLSTRQQEVDGEIKMVPCFKVKPIIKLHALQH